MDSINIISARSTPSTSGFNDKRSEGVLKRPFKIPKVITSTPAHKTVRNPHMLLDEYAQSDEETFRMFNNEKELLNKNRENIGYEVARIIRKKKDLEKQFNAKITELNEQLAALENSKKEIQSKIAMYGRISSVLSEHLK